MNMIGNCVGLSVFHAKSQCARTIGEVDRRWFTQIQTYLALALSSFFLDTVYLSSDPMHIRFQITVLPNLMNQDEIL